MTFYSLIFQFIFVKKTESIDHFVQGANISTVVFSSSIGGIHGVHDDLWGQVQL